MLTTDWPHFFADFSHVFKLFYTRKNTLARRAQIVISSYRVRYINKESNKPEDFPLKLLHRLSAVNRQHLTG